MLGRRIAKVKRIANPSHTPNRSADLDMYIDKPFWLKHLLESLAIAVHVRSRSALSCIVSLWSWQLDLLG